MLLGRRIAVVLPPYSAATLRHIQAEIPLDLVDGVMPVDASHDGSVALARSLGTNIQRHPCSRGYGAKQRSCHEIALERGADQVQFQAGCP